MLCWPYEVYMNEQVEEQRRQAVLQKAELERLLREAGVDQRGWMARLGSRCLGQLGHALVAWGRRLERYGTPVSGQPLKSQAI